MAFIAPLLPAITAIAAVGAAGVSALGAIQQGNATAAADKYNAEVEQQRAQQAQETAAAQAGQEQVQSRANVGQQEAAFAAGGLDVGSGTPLLVMSDTAAKGELKAALTQWQGQTQAAADVSQGTLDTAQGQAASTAGGIKAGSTLLTGLTQAGMSYYGGAGTSPSTNMPVTYSASGPGGLSPLG